MVKDLLLIFVLVLAVTLGSSSTVHTEVSGSTQQWTNTNFKPPLTEIITLGFAIKQQNLQKLEEIFFRVSDPHCSDFGRHLTIDELGSLVGAQDETLGGIQQWLKDNNAKSVTVSRTRDYVWGSFTSQEVETLLNIKLSVYSHQSTNSQDVILITRSEDSPVVPSHLAPHIDFISGVWHFPETERLKTNAPATQPVDNEFKPIWGMVGLPEHVLVYFFMVCLPFFNISDNAYNPCADLGNPIAMVNFTYTQFDYNKGEVVYGSEVRTPTGNWLNCSVGFSSQCWFEVKLLDDSYVENSTLQYCFADGTCTGINSYPTVVVPSLNLGPQDVRQYYDIPQTLVGSTNSSQAVVEFSHQFYSPSDLAQFFKMFGLTSYTVENSYGPNFPPSPGSEASLDIQYIMGVGQGVNTWFWYMTGRDWIAEWAQSVINTPEAPKVHSISYGEIERSGNRVGYYKRADIEMQKLGAAGHSILVSSGDSGTFACEQYEASWPASSPYVTAVGATRITRGATQECQQNPSGPDCYVVGEVSASADLGLTWTTGGGFSTYATIPSYQETVVTQYLKGPTVPNTSNFNSSNRAYPDIVAVGHNLQIVVNGEVTPIDGTSASTPIFAGMIGLINDQRLQAGKGTLGFLNQWLYSLDSSAFYDVTVGDTTVCNSNACCVPSFVATEGWDPASGLGSPRFPALLKSALTLP